MTIPRVLEPEVMDSVEEARDYNAMDHSQVNTRFVDDLLATEHPLQDVLDLGTGTALIPIELCNRHETCRVMASDLSIEMLELARYNLEVTRLTHRIQLARVDAKQMPFATAMFDTLISNSIVHHVPEPLQALAEAVRVTAPGGLLLVRDLVRPETLDDVERLVQLYAGAESARAQRMFRESLQAALTLDEIRSLVNQLGFAAASVQLTSDRHWTWNAVRPSA